MASLLQKVECTNTKPPMDTSGAAAADQPPASSSSMFEVLGNHSNHLRENIAHKVTHTPHRIILCRVALQRTTPRQMHSKYRGVVGLIRKKVEESGGRMRGKQTAHAAGRCKEAFVNGILKKCHLLKRKQSHACPICERLKRDRKTLERLQARFSLAEGEQKAAVGRQLDEISKFIAYGEHHQKRKKVQRQATIDTRTQLQPRGKEMLIFVDYVSYYLCSGQKQNTLVFEVETRDGDEPAGEISHRYFDFLAAHPHDGYFSIAGLRGLFEIFAAAGNGQPDLPEQMTFACDNGMISGLFTWALSKLSVEYSIEISVVPLAAYHAYNLCDSHGGHFKPALGRVACNDRELILPELKKEIEAVCSSTLVCGPLVPLCLHTTSHTSASCLLHMGF